MTTAVFTQGSTLKHILVMTLASAVGLVTLFFVDLVDMYFLSLLGENHLAAAVGYSGALLYFLTSGCIGLSIAMGANVARALGEHDRARAKAYVTNTLVYSVIVTIIITLPCMIWLRELLSFLGASGATLEFAIQYTIILLPTTAAIGIAMGLASALRAVGDAKHSMYAILSGGIANAVLDPILIFTFEMGIEGAAWASVAARFTMIFVAGFYVIKQHKLLEKFNVQSWLGDARAVFSVAGPAIMTNLVTPIGGGYVMKSMAEFGDGAVAGAAIIGRIVPVAFGALFALSGAMGPIIAQNMGAKQFDRVRSTVRNAVLFVFVYVVFIWLVLFLLRHHIVSVFDASDEAAMLIVEYCNWIALGFIFNGLLFVANATFNNIQAAHLATVSSFARSILGTIPLVYLFALWWGPVGVLAGEIAGAAVFGTLALMVAFYRIGKLEDEHPPQGQQTNESAICQWPYSSEKCALGQEIAESHVVEKIKASQ